MRTSVQNAEVNDDELNRLDRLDANLHAEFIAVNDLWGVVGGIADNLEVIETTTIHQILEERGDGLDILLADCLRVRLVEELERCEVHIPLDASNETADIHAVKRTLPRLEGLLTLLNDAIVDVVYCVVPVGVVDVSCLIHVGVEGGLGHVDYATAHSCWGIPPIVLLVGENVSTHCLD